MAYNIVPTAYLVTQESAQKVLATAPYDPSGFQAALLKACAFAQVQTLGPIRLERFHTDGSVTLIVRMTGNE